MAAPSAIATRPLRRNDWPTIERLFGANGACGGCWCMWWRVPMGGKAWAAARGAPNRRAFKALVDSGEASGILAFAGTEPVGWCAIAPRVQFPRIDRSRALHREWHRRTWSLNCLYVPSPHRGRGVAAGLVAAAVAYARRWGAAEIEAYPQALAPGERQAGAFVWTGVPSLFLAQGFVPLGPATRGRVPYLLTLD